MCHAPSPASRDVDGHTVVRAAFVLALFGWGVGFYGPPFFLHAVLARTGWPLSWVSAAVTCHFLFGAAVVACLPRIHRRLGIPTTTAGGAVLLAIGVLGWATAAAPWQLFVAALLTGGGWVPLGAAGINAIVSPWFVQERPMALAKAYNGASVGGMVFSLLWAVLMQSIGFPAAAMVVGLAMVTAVLSIASRELSRAPGGEGARADGVALGAASGTMAAPTPRAAAGPALWRDRRFLTLAAAMSLGLFAQVGLLAQLYGLLVPAMGSGRAGALLAAATGCAMAGRLAMGRLLTGRVDRRLAAGASYALQATGTLVLLMASPDQPLWLAAGVVLFGLGIGNATSLPPLIAQAEFAPVDVPRVVARCVAVSQALYAWAPAALAALLVPAAHGAPVLGASTELYFAAICTLQILAMACMLLSTATPSRPGQCMAGPGTA